MTRASWCGAALVVGLGLTACNTSTDSPGKPAAAPITKYEAMSPDEVVLSIPGMH